MNSTSNNENAVVQPERVNDNDGPYTYKYPHPALTVDCVVFGFDGESLKLLLIERGLEPYKGMWALPGGFMRINETLERAAMRELREETGVTDVYLDQFHVFSTLNRDPRERVVTVAFIALVRTSEYQLIAGDDAANAQWFDENRLPPLAFDHGEIIIAARQYLRQAIKMRPIAFTLLNEEFTVTELQKVYEAINGVKYDRRNFQRKLMQADILEERGIREPEVASRPPRVYALNPKTQRKVQMLRMASLSAKPNFSRAATAAMPMSHPDIEAAPLASGQKSISYCILPETNEEKKRRDMIRESRTILDYRLADKDKKEDEEDIGSIRDLFEF